MPTIESVSHESRLFEPPPAFAAQANVDQAELDRLNAAAAADYPGFWAKLAREELLWHKPFSRVLDESHAPFYKWFEDGELNASYDCLERNLQNGNANKIAILFEADDGTVTRVTYQDLYHRVCRLANGLKARGIKQGDRVIIYIPMSIEGMIGDAGLRAHRRDAFGSLRRLLREVAARAHRRCRRGRGHHRRRADARRQGAADQGDR